MSKNAVVTGGTRGIGKEICYQLAEKGYAVLLIGRDQVNGESVQSDIKQRYPGSQVTFLKGDLSSIQSTKAVISGIQQHVDGIDVLINNAGVWPIELEINQDGLEMAFMVNHLAPLMLIHGLLPQLRQNRPSRIVNVNAGLYGMGNLKLEETPYGKDFHKLKTYANTKLCNTMMTVELAERLAPEQIWLNALHPGVINTSLGDMGGVLGGILSIVKRFWVGPEKGAKPSVWLATAEELDGVYGKYFDKTKEIALSPKAKDKQIRVALWDKSLELTGIQWR